MKNAEAASLLTPGSVWFKEDGSKSVLLVVTNGTLSARAQAQHPPQAVYMDEEGNVYNRTVADFLSSRSFHNVVPEVEAGVEAVLGYRDLGEDGDEGDEDIDLSGLIIEGEEESDGTEEEELAAEQAALAPNQIVTFTAPPSLAAGAAEVALAVVGYQEQPMPMLDLTDHLFVIDPTKLTTLSLQQVVALFDPENPEVIEAFQVRGLPNRVWNNYIGAFNQVVASKNYLVIHLGIPVGAESEVLTGTALDEAIAAEEAKEHSIAAGEVTIEAGDTAGVATIPAGASNIAAPLSVAVN